MARDSAIGPPLHPYESKNSIQSPPFAAGNSSGNRRRWRRRNADNGLEQPGTVLDALSAAAVLDIFNHYSDILTMSNIAQTVNVLQCLIETDADEAWARPTYRVFDLYAPHKGNEAVQTSVETPVRDLEDDQERPLVGASASTAGDEAYVTVTNLDCRETHTVEVSLEGMALEPDAVDAEILFEDQAPETEVDADTAATDAADNLDVTADSGSLIADLPSSTVAGISIK
ncbi:hypothetical protein FEJ81_22575 (plasmid) [Natrinema versiforme]|uniref:Alpha-L-arabinofuranosidase C-terminal domain-containing protein n=1 Tax=Natrinema versiforme TaxID=88724 RepID=A0A4V1G0E3_9EURY|nr:hypothetical protein FEJ81_22575 [Natrinema versiforme]